MLPFKNVHCGEREVADPWAGSYLIESLTGRMVTEVRAVLAQIDAEGGILAALESGWVQRRIHQNALRTQARLDANEEVVVGVNRDREPGDDGQQCLEIDGTQVRVQQTRRLVALRGRRDDAAVRHALAALTEAARRGERNLLACAIDAVRCRATVGECTRALLQVWPRHTVRASYDAALYGTARAGNREWLAACECVSALRVRLGRAPRILVAKLGQDGHDRGAKAVAAGLADAGFVVELTPLFQPAEAVASAACDGDFDAIGISTLGGAHLELLPALLHALRQRASDVPVFVGGIVPAGHSRLLRQCGVQGIFGPGTPMEIIVSTIVAALTLSRMPTASAPFH